MKKVAINGFGRIGRMLLRAYFENGSDCGFSISAVNDIQPLESALYLLRHDSVHGGFAKRVEQISADEFSVNGHSIRYYQERDPRKLPWGSMGIDVAVESSGVFKKREEFEWHLQAGAKKVLLSFPSLEADKTIVCGVNDHDLFANDVIISNASCTTNCAAPIIKVLHEEFGVVGGNISTIHSYTSDQRLIDSAHRDLRRARCAAGNIIPTSTGAAVAIAQIFPQLSGKMSAMSFRVPTPNVSLLDLTVILADHHSEEAIRSKFVQYADGDLSGILACSAEPLVSSDFNHDPHSAIVDLSSISIAADNILHLVAWYDNEWGFANRMIQQCSRLC